MQYVVIIEETEGGGYSAYVPDLPVCFTVGDTLDEVKANIKSAIELYLEEARETGMVLPMPKTMSTLIEVQAAWNSRRLSIFFLFSSYSIILDQVENGVAVRMAVLYLLAQLWS